MKKQITSVILCLILFTSCSVLRKTAKQELTDGYYTQKVAGHKEVVYVDLADDTLRIYSTSTIKQAIVVDTTQVKQISRRIIKLSGDVRFVLAKKSFDIDFLTIPLKYRFSQKSVPPQLNANLNGAIYFGYRSDRYLIRYRAKPLTVAERETIHFGYSMGIFSGLGNTFLSPTNTGNALSQEYDGMVWSKGIAGILSVNSFTIGLSLGFDNLLDKNRHIWIYNSKPWLGLAFGLNLN